MSRGARPSLPRCIEIILSERSDLTLPDIEQTAPHSRLSGQRLKPVETFPGIPRSARTAVSRSASRSGLLARRYLADAQSLPVALSPRAPHTGARQTPRTSLAPLWGFASSYTSSMHSHESWTLLICRLARPTCRLSREIPCPLLPSVRAFDRDLPTGHFEKALTGSSE